MGCGTIKQYKIAAKDLNQLIKQIKQRSLEESGEILHAWVCQKSLLLHEQQVKNIRRNINETRKKFAEQRKEERRENNKFDENIKINMMEMKEYALFIMDLERKLEDAENNIKSQKQRRRQNFQKLKQIQKKKIIANSMDLEADKGYLQKINLSSFIQEKRKKLMNAINEFTNSQIQDKQIKDVLNTCLREIDQHLKKNIENQRILQQRINQLNSFNQSQAQSLQKYKNQIQKLQQDLQNLQDKLRISQSEKTSLSIQFQNYTLQHPILQSPVVQNSYQLSRAIPSNAKEFSFINKQSQQNSQEKHQRSSTGLEAAFGKFVKSSIVFPSYQVGKNIKHSITQLLEPYAKIKSTDLIFSFDRARPNNMFYYVKESSKNLLFLGQLSNGFVIGAFSEKSFRSPSEKLRQNIIFLFSINKNYQTIILGLRSYSMAEGSVRLDKNFLRFGNNEMRITCNKKEGICKLDPNGALFVRLDEDTISSMQFLGQQTDDFELNKYQIFELQLEWRETFLRRGITD